MNRPKLHQTGESPLHVACRKGRLDIVKFMLARGGLVNTDTADGLTPLHLAVRGESYSSLLNCIKTEFTGRLSVQVC